MAKPDPTILRLATTSSVQDSGLLGVLCRAFSQETARGATGEEGGIVVKTRAVGTGQALRLGRRGAADAVITHHPGTELQYVEGGHGVNRREFMTNDFVLVGPPADPAGAARQETVFDALGVIFRAQALFISRGDDSGTNLRELDLWAGAATLPFGRPWYRAAEGGMVRCLEAASEEGAYTLSDQGTFLAQAERLNLRILCADPRHLRNPYSVIATNPARHGHVNYATAMAFITFLTGARGQGLIGGFQTGPHALFHPEWNPSSAGKAAAARKVKGTRGKGGRLGRLR